ncbi:MAG: hypothetical protein EAZ99_13080 [Alphaproteobacteria bacterium]|nr:MAG: hypothetical protein EAZ99_13080 [Alphaproteobacteria bacterium]
MTANDSILLQQSTGLPDYDMARWSSLPPVRGVLRGEGGWGVLLQDPDIGPDGVRPVEVRVPELESVVLILGLAAGKNQGLVSGTGGVTPTLVSLKRGGKLLLPPAVSSIWHSNTGQERVLHVHLPVSFLTAVGEIGGMVARPDLLPVGALRADATLDSLLRHVVRQMTRREPGWRMAINSAITLVAARLLEPAAPRQQRGASSRLLRKALLQTKL